MPFGLANSTMAMLYVLLSVFSGKTMDDVLVIGTSWSDQQES